MSDTFTPEQLDRLAAQVEDQLSELASTGLKSFSRGPAAKKPPAKQANAIAAATGEDPVSFFERFKQNARKDICEPGGILHAQWQKWREVATKDLLKSIGGVLVGMGLATNTVLTVAVALAVWLLHIGVTSFCEWGA